MSVVVGGSKMNLVEEYTDGEDSQQNYGRHRYLAQTFTLDQETVLWRNRYKSWTICGGEFYHYGLRLTDGTGKPTGADIAHTTLSKTDEYWYSPGKWKRFDFREFPKVPAGVYALIISVPDSPSDQCYKARCDATASAYARGKAWESDDDGVTWSEIPNTDFIFEVWGYTPPPEPPPDPDISNFATKDVAFELFETAITITVTTDRVCHLWMRWTLTEPEVHAQILYRRGLAMHTDKRFCFVDWHENEQLEKGDTFIHTFIKPDWPVCQTRYFYFLGTRAGEQLPSTSALFKLHNNWTAPPFGPEITIKLWPDDDPETNTVDGWMYRYHDPDNWPEIREGAGTFSNDWYQLMYVRLDCSLTDGKYKRIDRCIFLFDTSVIPPGSLIVSARVGIFVSSKHKTSAWTIAPAIYQSFPLSDTSLALADYNRLHDTILSNAIEFADMDEVHVNLFELNADGLAAIVKGGITKLGLRDSKYDGANIPPPWAANVYCYVYCFTSDWGLLGDATFLEVTYREPG